MKINLIALAMCLGMVPLATTMAAPVQQTLKFSVFMPDPDFTIVPTKPWPSASTVTPISYNKVTETFDSYTNDMRITSVAQNVTAKLEKVATLVKTNDTAAVIPVKVMLDGKTLNLNAQQIHAKGDPKTYPLSIQPTGKGYPGGTYNGDVVLIFDAT